MNPPTSPSLANLTVLSNRTGQYCSANTLSPSMPGSKTDPLSRPHLHARRAHAIHRNLDLGAHRYAAMTLVLEKVGGQEGERRSARGEVGVEWAADILDEAAEKVHTVFGGEVVVEDDEGGVLGGATREHDLSLALIAECDAVR
ncbi:hypothetical protein Q9L58_008737 [Maublancomyces gigas]|uniref:Uncharacterized protein n=1 Tax=Discina gigas TaxID=1032678 RepID=A0ABR3G8V3_9PEZI